MKGHLSTVIPFLSKMQIPITRDRAFILFVALNELIMGLETYLAHVMNGTIRFNEVIPIICGPLFALMLVLSYITAKSSVKTALISAALALTGSIVVGILGTYFHVIRAIRPLAASGQQINLGLLVWGVPAFAPPTFTLVGILGLVALSSESNQVQSFAFDKELFKRLPFTKDKIYFILATFGVLIATVSSIFDHLRGGFENPWLWVPTISGMLGTVTALILASINQPNRGDLTVYTLVMGLLLTVGPLGLLLHIIFDLGPGGAVIIERFLRGAPVLAPMVYSNMGLMGLLVLLDPD